MGDPTLDLYAGSLAPPQFDRTEVSSRRSAALGALQRSSLAVNSMFESGSWSHGTGVKAHSDVDYMAVATSSRPSWPSSALAAAKSAVTGCDWKINGVAVSSPVVAITYYSPPNFEVAPAWFKETKAGFNVYWIAGRGDEWVLSAPAAHLNYVNRQNDRLSKKVKQLVRLMKAWKYHVGAPVSSFYLEMRTAEYASKESFIVYDVDLRRIMSTTIEYEMRDMNDPEHLVGRIPACASDEKRRRALSLARDALSNLNAADAAKQRGDRHTYWQSMRAVFGQDYPWPTW